MRHGQKVGQGSRRTSSNPRIPVVDLGDPRASEKLGHALSVFGVAALTGHGVPANGIDEYYNAAEQVFAHGDEVLGKYHPMIVGLFLT